jgi:hypothetical protein
MKNTHGGPGRGQGRKPLNPAPMPQTSIRISAADLALLNEVGGSTSAGVRLLCDWYRRQAQGLP